MGPVHGFAGACAEFDAQSWVAKGTLRPSAIEFPLLDLDVAPS